MRPWFLRNILTGSDDSVSDVQAFFDATGITDPVIQDAITVYVLDAKNNDNSWWNDTHADYPMVGGTAITCAVNLKNPGTFDINFTNTVGGDFTVNGWTPNGVTSYAKTGIVPVTHTNLNNVSLEFYSRTNILGSITWGVISIDNDEILQMRTSGGGGAAKFLFDSYNNTTGRILGGAPPNSIGGQLYVRSSSMRADIYANGVSQINITDGGGARPSLELYKGGRNNKGSADGFDSKQCAGAGCFNGLTAAQALAQYTARQTMNTALSRQV